jgi:hypothetical protein
MHTYECLGQTNENRKIYKSLDYEFIAKLFPSQHRGQISIISFTYVVRRKPKLNKLG